MEVEKIVIGKLIWFFIGYLVIHVGIVWRCNIIEKELKTKDDVDLKKEQKTMSILFNWFPAVYVIFILANLLFF